MISVDEVKSGDKLAKLATPLVASLQRLTGLGGGGGRRRRRNWNFLRPPLSSSTFFTIKKFDSGKPEFVLRETQNSNLFSPFLWTRKIAVSYFGVISAFDKNLNFHFKRLLRSSNKIFYLLPVVFRRSIIADLIFKK